MMTRWTVRKGRAGPVTVSWTAERVSFVRWAPQAGRRLMVRGSAEVLAEACTAAAYCGALAGLGGSGGGPVYWVVAPELLGMAGGGAGLAELPEWLEACWGGLAVRDHPVTVVCALASLERELRGLPEFGEPGTGAFFNLHGRGLFLAAAAEGMFRRISRMNPGPSASPVVFSAEWLQQTRMLYEGRTGGSLRRVVLPATGPVAGPPVTIAGVEVGSGMRVPAWQPRAETPLDPALLFLHASALRSTGDAGCRLQIPLLTGKLRRRRREAVWRNGSLLLLGGWLFLLLGACRNGAGENGVQAQLLPEWGAEMGQREDLSTRWHARERELRRSGEPFQLVGAIARSLPERVTLRRIRIRRTPGADDALLLGMEGTYAGEQASPVFRSWLNDLQAASPLAHVESLRFEQGAAGIAFHLEGRTNGKGGAR